MSASASSHRETPESSRVFEDLSGFLGEPPCSALAVDTARKMSQAETQPTVKRGVATRTVVLLIIIAGLSSGAAAFAFANAQAQTQNPSTSNLNTYNGQWPGLRGAGPLAWHDPNGSFTSFRAASTIANVSITGFNVVDSSHLTVTLSYKGIGTTPAATIVVVAPGLSGSNTLSAGWSSPSTVSVHLVGTGTLSSTMTCVRVLVVPLMGA